MSSTPNVPRGIRNNNPLNIVCAPTSWKGMSAKQTDQRFVQFERMEFGIRAALCILRTYVSVYGLSSVQGIIRRWCPDRTADTYIAQVCKYTGWKPTQVIRWDKYDEAITLLRAMARVECGQEVPEVYFAQAWVMFSTELRLDLV